jgi:hypothetical protein
MAGEKYVQFTVISPSFRHLVYLRAGAERVAMFVPWKHMQYVRAVQPQRFRICIPRPACNQSCYARA